MANDITILDSVLLTDYVYREPETEIPSGFSYLGGTDKYLEDVKPIEIENSGLYVETLQHDASGEIIIAIRGTDNQGADWVWENLAPLGSEQTTQMQQYAVNVVEQHGLQESSIHIVGDSLGDRLSADTARFLADPVKGAGYTDLSITGVGTNGPDAYIGDIDDHENINYVNVNSTGDIVHYGRFGESGHEIVLPIGNLGQALIDGTSVSGVVGGIIAAGSEALDTHTNRQATIDFFETYPNIGSLTNEQVAHLTPNQIEQIRNDPSSFEPFSLNGLTQGIDEVNQQLHVASNQLADVQQEIQYEQSLLDFAVIPEDVKQGHARIDQLNKQESELFKLY